jgi:hypothetical protein
LRNRAGACRTVAAADRGGGVRFAFLLPVIVCLPVLAGCSSSFSNMNGATSAPAQTAAAPPPGAAARPATGDTATSPMPYPSVSLVDYFKNDSTPAPSASAAGALPSNNSPPSTMPYPNQSISDLFRDSSSLSAPNMPHPPSTYTPSAPPYSPPPGQPNYPAAAANPAPVATAQPANSDPAVSNGAYPSQTLWDLFKSSSQ